MGQTLIKSQNNVALFWLIKRTLMTSPMAKDGRHISAMFWMLKLGFSLFSFDTERWASRDGRILLRGGTGGGADQILRLLLPIELSKLFGHQLPGFDFDLFRVPPDGLKWEGTQKMRATVSSSSGVGYFFIKATSQRARID
jgi:hypothetical protein